MAPWHIEDRWYKPKRDSDGRIILNVRGKPVSRSPPSCTARACDTASGTSDRMGVRAQVALQRADAVLASVVNIDQPICAVVLVGLGRQKDGWRQ